jgi:hypothetical protein
MSTSEALSSHLKNGMKSVLVDKINLLENLINEDKKSIFQVMSDLFDDIETFWSPDMNLMIFFKGYNIKNLQDLISDNLILDTDNKQYYLKQSVESLDRCITQASRNKQLYYRYI